MIMMIVSVPSVEIGRQIADRLLAKPIAGCIQIIKSVESIYLWKGKKELSDESILFIKVPKRNKQLAEEIIQKLHPYEVPEILSIDVSANESYNDWLYSVVPY